MANSSSYRLEVAVFKLNFSVTKQVMSWGSVKEHKASRSEINSYFMQIIRTRRAAQTLACKSILPPEHNQIAHSVSC